MDSEKYISKNVVVIVVPRGQSLSQFFRVLGMQGQPLYVGDARGITLNFTLLPEYLRDLGYKTHLIGKWHVGYFADAYLPTSRGFDTFFGYYNGFVDYYTYTIADTMSGLTGYDLHRDVSEKFMIDYTPKEIYATDLFTDEAEYVIANHVINDPLYLQMSHLAPHIAGPGEGLQVRDVSQVNDTFGYISHYERRLYAGMVSALDDSVGRIVEALDNKGILNDTIIVFTSDNGGLTVGQRANTGSNYPLRGLKFNLFEGGIRTPAFIWSSMIEQTSRIYDDYVHVTDWLPTLYSAAGGDVEKLGIVDGVNQWEAISRGVPGPRTSFLVNIDEIENVAAAVKEKFKYVTGVSETNGSYFGENADDGDRSAPAYNVTSVLHSRAARAIGNATKNDVKTVGKMIRKLRRANKIRCDRNISPANCTISCLFNLESDPCETTDVAAENPLIVQQFQGLLADYREVLVPQLILSTDPRSLPKKNGDPWMPWLTVDRQYSPHNLPVIYGNFTT